MQIICERCLDCIICSTFHIPTNKLLKHKFSFIFLSAKFFKRFLQGKLFFSKMKMQIQYLLYLKFVWFLEHFLEQEGKQKILSAFKVNTYLIYQGAYKVYKYFKGISTSSVSQKKITQGKIFVKFVISTKKNFKKQQQDEQHQMGILMLIMIFNINKRERRHHHHFRQQLTTILNVQYRK